jgi:hypothetical protein
MSDGGGQAAPRTTERKTVVAGLLAAPGLLHELARHMAGKLPGDLSARFPDFSWQIVVKKEPLAGPQGNGEDLIKVARQRLLDEGWDLAICLTDLPLHVGRRPVTAHASAALGVGIVSVPALGVLHLEANVRLAVVNLIEALVGEGVPDTDDGAQNGERFSRVRGWLETLSSPMGRIDVADDRTFRFVTAPSEGNLRLAIGMLRANRPWRVVVGLSRALVASVGTAALALTSPGVWMIAHGMGLIQMLMAAVASVAAICVSLIVAHGLWERNSGRTNPEARRRTALFNTITVLTVLIGVLTLYVTQLIINIAVVRLLISPSVLQRNVHSPVGIGDYLWLAWLTTSMAAVGGALGAALENNDAVREAAYGYRPEKRIEAQRSSS